MRNTRHIGLTVALTLAMGIAGVSRAAPFRVLGARALGMGGAGVAAARGAYAVYYNPAALAENCEETRLAAAFNAGYQDLGAAEALDRLADYEWERAIADPQGNAAEAEAIINELLALEDDDALALSSAGVLAGRICHAAAGSWGVGSILTAEAGATPVIDKDRLTISSPSDPRSLANNESEVLLQGIALLEVPVSYGTHIPIGEGRLNVGGSLKYLRAMTYDGVINVTDAASDDIGDRLDDFDEVSSSFGVDIGVLYRSANNVLGIGLLARNINSPEFDTVSGGDLKEEAQVRAGIEVALLERNITLALDADITKNETFVKGHDSQFIGGGINFEATPGAFLTALRLGAMQNMAESDPGIVFTGGVALGFKYVHLDIAGALSTEEGHYDGDTFPTETRLSVALESAW